MKKLLTIQEVSSQTGLSRGIVWRAVREGRLKLSKETRPTLVAESDVQDWLKTLEPPISKSDLERLYVADKKPMYEIAEFIGVGTMVVQRLMKSFGIPARSRTENMKGRNTRGDDPQKIAERKSNMRKPHGKICVTEQDRKRRSEFIVAQNKLPRTKEWTLKQSVSHAGENSYRWMGGSDHYRGSNFQRQRRKARQRDNFTCQRCGITEEELGQELDVHHISKYREFDDSSAANELDNLISYCKVCHGVVERELEKSGCKSANCGP